jgi:hypothetical protein
LKIIQDSTRFFSSDKSSFQFFPETGKVLPWKRDKNVIKLTVEVTAIFTFYASRTMCPPMLIYPYKRIPSEITHSAPDD